MRAPPRKPAIAGPKTGSTRAPTEIDQLLAEIEDPETKPERRLEIGDRLAELGDPRPGVGLDANGLPDIDWVEVPGGDFLFGDKKERRHLDTFWIARYPITNAQYRAFIDAGGYEDERWWEGLAERIQSPRDPGWSQANRPRESVTWREAVAFTRWLSERTGAEIRLPTEVEWEKAARGTDGREYPWGDGYRAGQANLDEKGKKDGPSDLGQTTAVGLYPHGASPLGLMDMAGNAWEWCVNPYTDPEKTDTGGRDPRALRGGSWRYNPENARAAYRSWHYPVFWYDDRGFRVLRVSPIEG
jgi:formylglycine-generating enzyme required for sulfatase activity